MVSVPAQDHLCSATSSCDCAHQSLNDLGDMVSAAQLCNLTFQSILDGQKGYDDDSKLNSLALVKLAFKNWSDVDLLCSFSDLTACAGS